MSGIRVRVVGQDRLRRAMDRFVAEVGVEHVPTVLRKVGADIVTDTVQSITTGEGGNPTRVDTGRYRAGWTLGGRAAGLELAGLPTQGGQSGDGHGHLLVQGARSELLVANAVEYASHVEYGTQRMAPGNHLLYAFERGAESLLGLLEGEITDAWGS